MEKNKEILISAKNINKIYDNKKIISNFNLDIYEGDRIGIIGSNGAGKTTISEIIGGIRKPTSGTVSKKRDTIVGFQFQVSNFPPGITVMNMIKYYLETFNSNMSYQQLFKQLNTYQLTHLVNKNVKSLSGGEQQRLNILLSMVHKPDLVILDEVSTGLDIEVKEEIFGFIEKNVLDKNMAMILVSHNMNEIELFCDQIIFMHEGQIIEKITVKEVVKKYGSVHEYTHRKFLQYKKPQLQKISGNLKNKYISDKRVVKSYKNHETSLIKLIAKYYLRSFYVPFFVFLYPIINMFLQGFAFANNQAALQKLVPAVAIMQIISIGIFFIPETIVEFKQSVLMKRIGATDIKKISFVLTIVLLGVLVSSFGFLWTLLWAGIFFGNTYTWSITSTPVQFWNCLPWLILIFISTISFGMMLSSLLKTYAAYIVIANIIYFPIEILAGGIISMQIIEQSPVLHVASFFSPFNYCIKPFINAWVGTFKFNQWAGISLGITLALIIFYIVIASWKLKWQE